MTVSCGLTTCSSAASNHFIAFLSLKVLCPCSWCWEASNCPGWCFSRFLHSYNKPYGILWDSNNGQSFMLQGVLDTQ